MKLLYAEDDAMNIMVMEYMLKSLEIDHVVVKNGKQLVEEYKKNPKKYHVIISDIHMPEMHGTEAVKRIRKYEKKNGLREIPVIFLTGNDDHNEREHCLDENREIRAKMYMSKPLKNEDQLFDALKKYYRKNTKRKKSDHTGFK